MRTVTLATLGACLALTSAAAAETPAELGGASLRDASIAGSTWKRQGAHHASVTTAPVRGRHQPPSGDFCDHLVAGGAGSANPETDLSAAHALVRDFSVDSPFGISDRALVPAVADARALTEPRITQTLQTYAADLGDVCALTAGHGALSDARVKLERDVAIVRPGRGPVTIPAQAQIVALDLRNLPNAAGLDGALERAAAAASTSPVRRPTLWLRRHHGPVDEAVLRFNAYSTGLTLRDRAPLAPAGSRELPLVVLSGDRMAPAAAEMAGTLRMAQRAWLLGDDVRSEVAEASWRGVGGHGIAARTELLDDLVAREAQQFADQTATQDDPSDPATAGYRRDLTVAAGTRQIAVGTDGSPNADLDLYLMYDADENGDFAFPDELVAFSATGSADEHLELVGLPDPGRYQVWVHGFSVPTPADARFDLTVTTARGNVWPDVIPESAAGSLDTDKDIAAAARAAIQTPLDPVDGPVGRSVPQQVDPFGDAHPAVTDKPELRAALLIAHGMTRMWFPYFHVVGDPIDSRLRETLAAVDAWNRTDRKVAVDILRRFGEALQDGHQFVSSVAPMLLVPNIYAGFIPIFPEQIDGRPVVRRSAIDSIHAGDTILAIDGRPIEDVLAEQYRKTSAATPGWRFDQAMQWVQRINGPTQLLLADPEGVTRTVVVDPHPTSTLLRAFGPRVTDRPSGPLDDLGAPDLYFLNLNDFTSRNTAAVRAALADAVARDARGLVLDMRGSPAFDVYEIAARLIHEPFGSPQFHVTTRIGPDTASIANHGFTLPPFAGPPIWDGPIVLLTGPHAFSAAETFMQTLVGAGRLTAVVGQRSGGTNGNRTGLNLPGGYRFSYTGMEVRNVDGSTFHGVGIVPDVTVRHTPADLRDGIDRDLLAAIDVFGHWMPACTK